MIPNDANTLGNNVRIKVLFSTNLCRSMAAAGHFVKGVKSSMVYQEESEDDGKHNVQEPHLGQGSFLFYVYQLVLCV